MLKPVFDQFVKKSPITVMTRGIMERVLDPEQLDKCGRCRASCRLNV